MKKKRVEFKYSKGNNEDIIINFVEQIEYRYFRKRTPN
jgi:hypothetical protein